MSSQFNRLFRDLADATDVERKKHDTETANRLVNLCFKQQRDFVLDKARRKSALCPRRSGKSFCCLVLMCRTALTRPGSLIKYVCLTRGQAKDNLWGALKKFSEQFDLALSYHETDIRATFPNGSIITFAGAETRQEIEKIRGQSYDLLVIDEAKSFQAEILHEFIVEIASPTLSDRFGTLAMIGTPGNILAGPFYEATSAYDPSDPTDKRKHKNRAYADRSVTPLKKGWWSFHSWHTKHNTAMPHIWADALEMKEGLGTPDNDPSWRREWLGEWCPSDSLMVYSYSRELNTYDGNLPEGHTWQYLLGLDLGYNDSTAIVVAAFSDTHPDMFQVYEWKEPNLTIDMIQKQIVRVQKRFPDLNAMIADTGGLGKTIVESLRERGFAFEAAVKTDKLDHIELVNSDLMAGRIKLLPDSHLAAEMTLLQWKDSSYKKENKDTDNHLCFAPGTIVTTETGPKYIEDIKPGDMVLTHKNRFMPVKTNLARKYVGKALVMRFAGHEPFTCTPEHKLLSVEYTRSKEDGRTGQQVPGETSWLPAREFDKPTPNGSSHVRVNEPVAPLGTNNDVLQAFVDGYYAAEGSCSPHAGGVSFAGHQQEKAVFALLQEFHPRFKWRDTDDSNGRVCYVYSKELVDRYSRFLTSTEKCIAVNVFDYSKSAAQALLEGYFHGDGHFSKAHKIVSSSVSRTLAYQIYDLARALGYSPSIHKNNRQHFECRGKSMNDSWTVSLGRADSKKFLENSHWPHLWEDKTSHLPTEQYQLPKFYGQQAGARLTSKEEIDYDGLVYSMEVEGDHSYTVNGVTAKNCDAFLYLIRHAYHHFWEPAVVKPAENTDEYWAEFEEAELESMLSQHASASSDNGEVLDSLDNDIALDGLWLTGRKPWMN